MSAIFTYSLFGGLFLLVLTLIYLDLKGKARHVSIDPIVFILAVFFILAYSLTDLTTLQMSEEGIKSTNFVIPTTSAAVPSIFIWLITVAAMGSISFFFIKKLKRSRSVEPLRTGAIVSVYSQALGLALFVIFAAGLVLLGHDSVLFGFYTLGLYHACIPLIIIFDMYLVLFLD